MNPDELARMRSLIDRHLADGEYVIHSARMVGDDEDHAIWRQSRRKWCDDSLATVSRIAPESADELRLCCGVPAAEENWKQQYVAELKSVELALEHLVDVGERLEPRVLDAVFA
jgi:hypothetical protein